MFHYDQKVFRRTSGVAIWSAIREPPSDVGLIDETRTVAKLESVDALHFIQVEQIVESDMRGDDAASIKERGRRGDQSTILASTKERVKIAYAPPLVGLVVVDNITSVLWRIA